MIRSMESYGSKSNFCPKKHSCSGRKKGLCKSNCRLSQFTWFTFTIPLLKSYFDSDKRLVFKDQTVQKESVLEILFDTTNQQDDRCKSPEVFEIDSSDRYPYHT